MSVILTLWGRRARSTAKSLAAQAALTTAMGNPGEFTIRELAEKVVEMTGSKSVISYEPLPCDDPKQRKPDITLAREKLGWEPKVALEEGLIKTIAYFEKQLKDGLA